MKMTTVIQQVLMDSHRPHLAMGNFPVPHSFKFNRCPVFFSWKVL